MSRSARNRRAVGKQRRAWVHVHVQYQELLTTVAGGVERLEKERENSPHPGNLKKTRDTNACITGLSPCAVRCLVKRTWSCVCACICRDPSSEIGSSFAKETTRYSENSSRHVAKGQLLPVVNGTRMHAYTTVQTVDDLPRCCCTRGFRRVPRKP